ncbi:MAG: hypothetical protein ACI9YT_001123 [Halobacteriales archaeon]|jgi:hypothetical protein
MVPPDGNHGNSAPIDRPILESIRDRFQTTRQVETARIADEGHHELLVRFADDFYPESVTRATLSVRWYTNDDFMTHYREAHTADDWECRWDRHPNNQDHRDHYHPPPNARTPAQDASWPDDYREMLSQVMNEIEERIAELWAG